MQVSHKRFLGWEPRTTYEYDSDGRVVASTVEPEWDELQRNLMTAFFLYRDELCPVCGGDRDFCGDESKVRGLGTQVVRCHVGTVRERDIEAEQASDYVIPQPGSRYRVMRFKDSI